MAEKQAEIEAKLKDMDDKLTKKIQVENKARLKEAEANIEE